MKKVLLIIIIFFNLSSLLSQKSFKIIFSLKDSSLEYKKLVTNYFNESYSIIESVGLKAFEIPISGNNISLDIVNACLEPSLTLYYKGLKFKKKIPRVGGEENVFKTRILKNFNKIKYISLYENECGLEGVELILKSLD
jgi:hypothetical protein